MERNDFIQGAYNPDAHAFTEWSDQRLQDRLNELHENNRIIGYSGERLRQITNEMTHIAFEMSERFREKKHQEIAEAWAYRDEIVERMDGNTEGI